MKNAKNKVFITPDETSPNLQICNTIGELYKMLIALNGIKSSRFFIKHLLHAVEYDLNFRK